MIRNPQIETAIALFTFEQFLRKPLCSGSIAMWPSDFRKYYAADAMKDRSRQRRRRLGLLDPVKVTLA